MTRCDYIDVGFRTLLQRILQGRTVVQAVALLPVTEKDRAHPSQPMWAL
jgi:hypothetical protein